MNTSATNKGGRRPKPVAPETALAMLASALGYCQLAGLRVVQLNEGSDLITRIVGAQVNTGADGINRFSLLKPETTMMANEAA